MLAIKFVELEKHSPKPSSGMNDIRLTPSLLENRRASFTSGQRVSGGELSLLGHKKGFLGLPEWFEKEPSQNLYHLLPVPTLGNLSVNLGGAQAVFRKGNVFTCLGF